MLDKKIRSNFYWGFLEQIEDDSFFAFCFLPSLFPSCVTLPIFIQKIHLNIDQTFRQTVNNVESFVELRCLNPLLKFKFYSIFPLLVRYQKTFKQPAQQNRSFLMYVLFYIQLEKVSEQEISNVNWINVDENDTNNNIQKNQGHFSQKNTRGKSGAMFFIWVSWPYFQIKSDQNTVHFAYMYYIDEQIQFT